MAQNLLAAGSSVSAGRRFTGRWNAQPKRRNEGEVGERRAVMAAAVAKANAAS
jgi:hypothetical protein